MKKQKRAKKKGCLGCLVVLLVLVAALFVGLVVLVEGDKTEQNNAAITTLNGYCETVGNQMTLELGMVVDGYCKKEGEATFHVMTKLTDAQIEWKYNFEREEIRQIWVDIARAIANYCTEQGFKVPDETTVFLNSADKKFVVMQTHDTLLLE